MLGDAAGTEVWLDVLRSGVTVTSVTFPNGAVAITDWLNIGTATAASSQGDYSWSFRALAPDGTSSNPAYTFGAQATFGSYRRASEVLSYVSASAGTFFEIVGQSTPQFKLHSSAQFGWTSGDATGALTTTLSIDAAGYLALRGSSAATFRVYGSTNYTFLTHDGTDGTVATNSGKLVLTSAAASEVVVNDAQADVDFRVEGDSISHLLFLDATATTENIAVFASAAPNWQSMDRGLFIGDTSTAPTGNPSSGGFLYSESGALKWRGSSGTVTVIAPA